ncbi:SdrD B-like domain-containing protein [Curtobacterium sp. MCBD17_023]|uniref:SdrD B-like domain-containing protein n=1 Tax=Curtobacterium sp. MCBD17_023 TaxID=2175657 RepID=UPI0015E8E6CB|nr:SdrD B-like domain-containing protein [Curtobacterium sp. MCBD17_023]
MRPRIPSRIAVTVVTAASLVLTVATPTWAVAGRPSTSAPAASTAPAPVPSTGPSPAASTAPSPATSTGPATSTDAEVGLAIEVAKDGNGPFTPDDQPGGDSGAANGIVRTLDAITYRVTMNSTGGASSHERFTLTAPAGTSWAAVPSRCTGSGSRIDGQELVCDLDSVPEGRAVAVPAVLDVSAELRHGDTITVRATGTADDADNGTVTATSPTTTVSAAARYNLAKDIQASSLRTDVTGPGGQRGIQLVYPIAVDWQPVVPGQGLLGFEGAGGPMTFTDDVSQILGDLPSGARLWNGDEPVCGPNSRAASGFGGLPAGKGGGARAVADSGTISCAQSGPGEDVDVTITGTVTDPTRMPTENQYGGPIAGGKVGLVVAGYISFWLPEPTGGTNVLSRNTFTPLQTTSASGAPNFPGGTEPTADNVSERNLVEFDPGSGGKRLYRLVGDAHEVRPGSARQGDPWATAGVRLRSEVTMSNGGLSAYQDAVLCDTFDRATQRLTRVGSPSRAAEATGLSDAHVQYAAYDMTSAAAGQRRTCDDEDGPWYDAPEDVPGGVAAVGAVRAVGDLAGGRHAALYSWVTVLDAPDGTRALDFGHLSSGTQHPGWIHDSADPSLGVGGLTDSVVITENLARIAKKTVDPGHDAADTPDRTTSAVAGDTLEYALYPTLTNGNTKGRPATVTVRDTLPVDTTYVPGSASTTPAVDTVQDAQGRRHQRLTWTMHDVRPNSSIPPITYRATISTAAPAGPIDNVAEVASPTDASPAEYRRAQRAVQVTTTGGVGVEEHAVEPVVAAGDRLEWDLVYTNTDPDPFHGSDLIDVLPDRTAAHDGSFHGRTGLAEAVAVDTGAGEQVRYTAAAPGAVSLVGTDPSNQPGGSTTWCSEQEFGADGCPASLRDVTAIRITRTAQVAVGASVTHRLALATEGEQDGDTYVNRFGLSVAGIRLPVQSNRATIRVVAGAIGDRVWSDRDGDGLQGADEPGVEAVDVRLTGTDDSGEAVQRRTTSDADGGYRFDGLRPGAYVVTFDAPDDRSFTRQHVGDDDAVDSDAGEDGSTETITLRRVTTPEGALDGVDRTTSVDAGVLPAEDTGGPGDGGPGDGGPGDGGPGDGGPGDGGPGDGGPGAPGGTGTGTGTGSPGSAGGSGRPAEQSSASVPDRAQTAGAARRGDLAFTGVAGLPIALGAALLLLALGSAIVLGRRGRARRR